MYNRAKTLPRLHASLLRQSYPTFEWVLVDDGSDDVTEALIQRWLEAGELDLVVTHQPNCGKHVAVNRGVELARGQVSVIVDSNDWFAPRALERLLHHWHTIPEKQRGAFSGVVGLCAYEDGSVIGSRYPIDPLDCDPAS